MPSVTIVSPLRDAANYLDRYISQIKHLDFDSQNIRIVLVEGDSQDDTLSQLERWQAEDSRIRIVKHDTGRPKFRSVVNAARFAHLAEVFNVGLEAVDQDWTDYVWFLPADVIYDSPILANLLGHNKDHIAPMFWTKNGSGLRFYDIWGFTADNKTFKPSTPAWYSQNMSRQPFEVDTVGGAALMRIEIIKAGCRFTSKEVDRGLCKMAKAAGFSIWCDPTSHIIHG